jgi:hypothetical protein
MRRLLLAAASVLFVCGGAYAQNANVPSNSPYAIIEPGAAARVDPMYERAYRYRPRLHERRSAFRVPNYAHDTGPPPGLMSDQPSTIGGYPIGY